MHTACSLTVSQSIQRTGSAQYPRMQTPLDVDPSPHGWNPPGMPSPGCRPPLHAEPTPPPRWPCRWGSLSKRRTLIHSTPPLDTPGCRPPSPVNRMTDGCKNIAFANFVWGSKNIMIVYDWEKTKHSAFLSTHDFSNDKETHASWSLLMAHWSPRLLM